MTWLEDEKRFGEREEIIEKIDFFFDGERFKEALQWERRLVDEFHEARWLCTLLEKVAFTEEERQQLVQCDDASTLFFVGYMLYCGGGGARTDDAAAYRCFERASEMGHVYARYMRGIMLYDGEGVAKDEELALQLCMEAAQQGCGEAAWWAGFQWRLKGDYRQATHYSALAVTLHFDAQEDLDAMLDDYPMEACPFGEWAPTRLMHMQVPPKIKEAMFAALLVLRARRDSPTWVHLGVAHVILSYVCTKGGWKNL